jgi:hypothetical protein
MLKSDENIYSHSFSHMRSEKHWQNDIFRANSRRLKKASRYCQYKCDRIVPPCPGVWRSAPKNLARFQLKKENMIFMSEIEKLAHTKTEFSFCDLERFKARWFILVRNQMNHSNRYSFPGLSTREIHKPESKTSQNNNLRISIFIWAIQMKIYSNIFPSGGRSTFNFWCR